MSQGSQTSQSLDSESLDNRDSSRDSQDLMDKFYLERYNYILQQIRSLNENVHKYLTFFQTLAAAITTAGVAVFVGRQQLNLTAEITKTAIQGLLGLLVILAAFVILSIIVGIFSWFDYRSEEVRLLKKALKSSFDPTFRKPPKWSNFWRWQETHAILFVVLVVIAIIIYVQSQIIPLIK